MTQLTPEQAAQRMPEKRGRRPKYPWKVWTNGEWHELWWERDYTCSTSSMQARCHGYASKNRLRAETATVDEETLLVRFHPAVITVRPRRIVIDTVKPAGPSSDYDVLGVLESGPAG